MHLRRAASIHAAGPADANRWGHGRHASWREFRTKKERSDASCTWLGVRRACWAEAPNKKPTVEGGLFHRTIEALAYCARPTPESPCSSGGGVPATASSDCA